MPTFWNPLIKVFLTSKQKQTKSTYPLSVSCCWLTNNLINLQVSWTILLICARLWRHCPACFSRTVPARKIVLSFLSYLILCLASCDFCTWRQQGLVNSRACRFPAYSVDQNKLQGQPKRKGRSGELEPFLTKSSYNHTVGEFKGWDCDIICNSHIGRLPQIYF